MTGYLQRLATSVREPARLHPFVGSMFADPPPEAAAPVLPHVDLSAAPEDQTAATSAAAPDHAERTPAPAAPPMGALPAQVRRGDEQQIVEPRADCTDSDARDTDDARSDRAGTARASFRPLLPPAAVEAEVEATATTGPDGTDARPATSRAQSLAPRTGRREAARATPLVLPRPAASLDDVERPLAALSAPGAAHKSAADERRTAARPRNSDDVHIHIGRVEVTAVPPPTPRQAAAPARKTMTLEEYLGRRNGAPR